MLLASTLHSCEKLILQRSHEECDLRTILRRNNVVGFYFAAAWHAPCKTFTLQLSEFYESLKKKRIAKLRKPTIDSGQQNSAILPEDMSFEVVFVSLDRDLSNAEQQSATMPWWSVPWQQASIRVIEFKILASFKLNVNCFRPDWQLPVAYGVLPPWF